MRFARELSKVMAPVYQRERAVRKCLLLLSWAIWRLKILAGVTLLSRALCRPGIFSRPPEIRNQNRKSKIPWVLWRFWLL